MKFRKLLNEYAIAGFALLALAGGFLYKPLFVHGNIVPFDIVQEFDDASPQKAKAQNYLLSDAMHQFFPAQTFTQQEMRSGHIPWINPYQFGGTPFFADPQNRIFELTRIVFLPFGMSAEATLMLSALLTLTLAGFFMYGFMRAIHMPYFIAFGGAIAWMLSGPMAVWLQYPLVSTAIWIPCILWSLTKIFLNSDNRFLILLAMGIFFQALGGQPQMLAISAVLYIAYLLFLFFKQAQHRQKKSLAACASVFLCALCASFFLLGPATSFVASSASYERGRGAARVESAVSLVKNYATHPLGTIKQFAKKTATFGITSILPNYYGNPLSRNYRFPEQSPLLNFSEMANYAGILIALLAVIALFWIKKANILFWLTTALISFGLSARLPFFELSEHLPLFGKINMGRFRFLFVFAIICLACIALSKITLRFKHSTRVSLNAAFMCIIAVDLFLAFSGYNPGADRQILAQYKNSPAISYLAQHANGRIIGLGKPGSSFRSPLVPNMATVIGIKDIRGSNPVTAKGISNFAQTYLDYKGSYILASSLPPEDILNQLDIGTVICEQTRCDTAFPREGWNREFADDRIQIYFSEEVRQSNNAPQVLGTPTKPTMTIWLLLSGVGAVALIIILSIANSRKNQTAGQGVKT